MDVKIALVVLCIMSLYVTQSTGETVESGTAEIDNDDINTKTEDNFDGVNELERKRKSLGQKLEMSKRREKRRNAMVSNIGDAYYGQVAREADYEGKFNVDNIYRDYYEGVNDNGYHPILLLMGKQSRQKGSYKSIKKVIRGDSFVMNVEIRDLRDEENTPEQFVQNKGQESLEEEIEPEDLPVIKVHVKHI